MFWNYVHIMKGASHVALVVKNPPVNEETLEMWVWSLGWEDPLEEGMATHSSIFALENPMDCGVGEDSWESLGLQGDPTSPS